MVTADRSAPLRRVGSLLGLLGLEVAAVAGLHWLGRYPALRIPWDRPLPWLLDSPVQEVLGSLARMVGLVMAYWLLASSLLYLLASLSQLPAAVRAVRWLTLPLVRRVADHAVAVTLATSMVGGGTLASAGPAGAAPSRAGGVGPPGHRGPVAAAPAPAPTRRWAATALGAARDAAQPTSGTAGQEEPSPPRYRPTPAGKGPTTAAPTTTRPATGDTDGSGPQGRAAGQPTSTTLRPPAHRFNPAGTTTTTVPKAGRSPGEPGNEPGSGSKSESSGGSGQRGAEQPMTHRVVRGDNLWTIARDHLAAELGRRAADLSDREIGAYWSTVVEENRGRLRSGDPDLIFPGEMVELPPVPGR
jgi:nucleoid-associated protein YgaU